MKPASGSPTALYSAYRSIRYHLEAGARRQREVSIIGVQAGVAHVLRHSAPMELLQAGVDCSVIALWLGHELIETTQTYLSW